MRTHSPTPSQKKADPGLISLDFILLFFMTLFSNCYLSIYYCFEQWLEHVAVDPSWRGILLGILFGMVLVTRPFATVFMLRRNRLPAVIISLFICSGVLFSYQFLDTTAPSFEWLLLALRIVQGIFLAIYSSCVVSVLVSCIPPGQSARGFALFSFTTLLPYAIIPTIGEFLLPIVGSEPSLFAWTSLLLVPCLVMSILLAPRLRQTDAAAGATTNFAEYRKGLMHSVLHSGLSLVFASMLSFSLATSTCLFFMKGLCSQTGGDPAKFYFYYTTTMIVLRFFFSKRLDTLPRYRIVPIVALTMASALIIIAWGPLWAYVPATILYGISLSLLYPLTAAAIYDRSTPETRTINSNFMMLMFDAGGLFSPMIGGFVISIGLDYHAVITVAAGMVCMSGLFFTLDRLRLYLQEVRARREA